MVPPAPAAHDHADPAWLTRIGNILHLTKGGVIIGLEGAHPGCAGPLIERLREGSADVRVCFSGREILAVPEGSRVVLLHAARDAEFLNMVRPVVAERRLRVFVWLQPGDRRELSRRARDFLDWVQVTIDVPRFVPEYAMAALRRALDGGASVVWEGPSLSELIPEVAVLLPNADDGQALAAMRQGPVVVRDARGVEEVGRFEALHRATGGEFGIIWERPDVLPQCAERVIADPLDWQLASTWLDEAGIQDPRVEAARLHLDPVAIAHRAGREPPPLLAAKSAVGATSAAAAGSGGMHSYFPSGSVTLTAEIDEHGGLEVRHQGVPLGDYDDALVIVEVPSSLPL
jgi:hypothetical protein